MIFRRISYDNFLTIRFGLAFRVSQLEVFIVKPKLSEYVERNFDLKNCNHDIFIRTACILFYIKLSYKEFGWGEYY